jgi:hypothetical protein
MYVVQLQLAAGRIVDVVDLDWKGRQFLADFGEVVSLEQLVQKSRVDAGFQVAGCPLAVELAEPDYLPPPSAVIFYEAVEKADLEGSSSRLPQPSAATVY